MSHFIYCYAECRNAECHYAECRISSIVMLKAEYRNAECYAEYRYGECHYADCRISSIVMLKIIMLNGVMPSVVILKVAVLCPLLC